MYGENTYVWATTSVSEHVVECTACAYTQQWLSAAKRTAVRAGAGRAQSSTPEYPLITLEYPLSLLAVLPVHKF